MTTGIRKPGDFCWVNLLVPDPAAAREFFSQLLGWSYVEIPMGHAIRVGGHDIGGLFDLNGPNTPAGSVAEIGVMVKVEKVDSTGGAIRELGGIAGRPFDVGPRGRMASCSDPLGAKFDLWQSGTGPGTDIDSTLHGAPSWFELLTSDTGAAEVFYHELFGWEAESAPAPVPGGSYTHFALDGHPIAGVLPIIPEMGAITPRWWTYFTVDDIDRRVEQAVKLGANISLPIKHAAEVGRLAMLTSPQGIPFYVISYGQ